MYLFREKNNYFIVDKKEIESFYNRLERNILSSAYVSIDQIEYIPRSQEEKERFSFLKNKIPYIISIGILEYNEYRESFSAVMVKTYIYNKYDNIKELKESLIEMVTFVERYLADRKILSVVCNSKRELVKIYEIMENLNVQSSRLKNIFDTDSYFDMEKEMNNKKMVSVLSENFKFDQYIDDIASELYTYEKVTRKDVDAVKFCLEQNREVPKPVFKKFTKKNIVEIQKMNLKLNFIYQFKGLNYDVALNTQMQKKSLEKLDIFDFKKKSINKKKITKWGVEEL